MGGWRPFPEIKTIYLLRVVLSGIQECCAETSLDGYAGDPPGVGATAHAIGKVQMISLRPEPAGRVSACDFVWRKPMRPGSSSRR